MKTPTATDNVLRAVVLGSALAAAAPAWAAGDSDGFCLVSPVTNPLFFEDPQIRTEIRPLFIYHGLPDNVGQAQVPLGGDVRVYAVQARWAITDRLALIATKDGYVDFNPDKTLAGTDGWADLGAGLKYALIKDVERKFILTPGVKFELPTGEGKVFQGNGSGEFDLFISSAKQWGNFELMGNAGLRLPIDQNEETMQAHYSVQLAYPLHKYFKPFATASAFTVLSEGDGTAFAPASSLGFEGGDLINWGASGADGKTQVYVGGGFRSALCSFADLGFAGEVGVGDHKGLFDKRFTVDLAIHF